MKEGVSVIETDIDLLSEQLALALRILYRAKLITFPEDGNPIYYDFLEKANHIIRCPYTKYFVKTLIKNANRIIGDRIVISSEAFDKTKNKIEAACKLVWLRFNSPQVTIIPIYSSVMEDYFSKYYKLSDAQLSKINSDETSEFIKKYFSIIDQGFNNDNINKCKKMAEDFFNINIEY